MSTRSAATPARTPPALAWCVVVLGIASLLLRSRVLALPDTDRIVVLTLMYAALLVPSLLVPSAPGERASPRRCFVVFAVGAAGVGAALVAGGAPVAVPFGPWVLPLSILAAVSEEAFFRGMAYGLIQRRGGAGVAVLVTAVGFAAIHVPLYGVAAVPIDLGAGMLLGWQRWETGDWTVPAATHVAANLIAVISR